MHICRSLFLYNDLPGVNPMTNDRDDTLLLLNDQSGLVEVTVRCFPGLVVTIPTGGFQSLSG
jgi:hypothetical protein